MIKANYHTHLFYCNHAEGDSFDYIEEALKNNFLEIGITDHAPVLECFMTEAEYRHTWSHQPMKLDTMYTKYLPEVRKAKDFFKDKIKVYTGFEVEYLPGNKYYIEKLRKEVDYLNLGVHFYYLDGKVLNTYYDVDYKTIYGYLNTAIEAIETGLFNTLVHPDLFMFSYKNKYGKREFDDAAYDVSKKLIECCIKNNVYLELNANGLRNSIVYSDGTGWLYPYKDFWKLVSEYKDVKVIIGADAHRTSALACDNITQVEKFAEELGIKISDFMEINH